VPGERRRSFRGSSSRRRSRWNWVRQADRDAGRRTDGPTSIEREELTKLRRENARLRQERDILAKAAAWFARESRTTPSGFAGS
jgi:transposase